MTRTRTAFAVALIMLLPMAGAALAPTVTPPGSMGTTAPPSTTPMPAASSPTQCPQKTACPDGQHPLPCSTEPCELGCGCTACPPCGRGEVADNHANFCRCIDSRTLTPIRVPRCSGDCNDDGRVDISELVGGVRAALGASEDQQCLVAFDRDRTGVLTIDEILLAMRSALTGCGDSTPDSHTLACRNSGGVVSSEYCCSGVGDFWDACSTDACGACGPTAARHPVTSCWCGFPRCFDGTRCVGDATRTPTPTLDLSFPTPTPTPDDSGLPCVDSGGTISTRLCCLGARPFPNTCRFGPCACPPDVSEPVRVCECGAGRCYDDSSLGGCVDGELAIP